MHESRSLVNNFQNLFPNHFHLPLSFSQINENYSEFVSESLSITIFVCERWSEFVKMNQKMKHIYSTKYIIIYTSD